MPPPAQLSHGLLGALTHRPGGLWVRHAQREEELRGLVRQPQGLSRVEKRGDLASVVPPSSRPSFEGQQLLTPCHTSHLLLTDPGRPLTRCPAPASAQTAAGLQRQNCRPSSRGPAAADPWCCCSQPWTYWAGTRTAWERTHGWSQPCVASSWMRPPLTGTHTGLVPHHPALSSAALSPKEGSRGMWRGKKVEKLTA